MAKRASLKGQKGGPLDSLVGAEPPPLPIGAPEPAPAEADAPQPLGLAASASGQHSVAWSILLRALDVDWLLG